MTSIEATDPVAGAYVRRQGSVLRRIRDVQRRWPFFSGAILAVFVLAGTVGPYLAPHDPDTINLGARLLPPAFASGGESSHLLGTDDLGRDVLTRLLYGARVSLLVAVSVVGMAGAFGVLIAVLSGYLGGKLDALLMRITDAVLAFPFLLLAIVFVNVFGASTKNVILLLAFAGWPGYARVLRSEVLQLKTTDYVRMARVMGASPAWVIARHIVPNIVSTFLVLSSLQLGQSILAEGSLSFLGLGVPPPAASWGGMLASGRKFLATSWWYPTVPGVALSLTVLSANLMGDWLRNVTDPAHNR